MDETHAGDRGTRKVGRAVFLGTVLGGVSALYWGKAGWGKVSAVIAPFENQVPLIPNGGWRIYTVSGSMPTFDPKTWKLAIGGQVEKPMSLSYDELRALPKVEQVSTFHCVTGWTVKNVSWGGVRLNDVLAPASPNPNAHALEFVSAEIPYVDSLTTQQAGLHDVMLAYEMDGKPLPRIHGAPVRLVIPEMYGYKNVKWLKGINLVPKAAEGYWEQLGYDSDAWVGRSNGYGT
ncbi:MAG TPA: molybdopterin-dependent oxidoreductase [Gaiellaceae bacterium]|jgi:DMSO/TMAO reductase YedYZ molybdopterin-dependent catalytic subunit|nr:molybdopterin-dependent oxidoreductase [Gaiellaceae bacterium]